jgi:hypothetical protein
LFFDQLGSAFLATRLYIRHLVDIHVALLLCAESTPYGIVRLRVLGRVPARGVSGLPGLGLEETVQNWSIDREDGDNLEPGLDEVVIEQCRIVDLRLLAGPKLRRVRLGRRHQWIGYNAR